VSRLGGNISEAHDASDEVERSSTWFNDTPEVRSKHEFRLLRDLMTNYEPAALPSLNTSVAVTVKMGIALFQIRELVCCHSLASELLMLQPYSKAKAKASHTRYRALGTELIPVYRQSACR